MAISPIVTVPLDLETADGSGTVSAVVSLATARELAADLKVFLTQIDRATDKIQKG
jgi:hypothetical protein